MPGSPYFRRRQRDPVLLVWLRLVRVVKKARHHVAGPVEKANLSEGQFDVLVEVGIHEGANQQECATRLAVTKGNISQHVSQLEARGLLLRSAEGRANALYLTQDGWRLLQDVMPAHDSGVRHMLGSLTNDELRQLGTLLTKIDRNRS